MDSFSHKAASLQTSMFAGSNPYDKAMIEYSIKILKQEEGYISEYETLEEARKGISYFFEVVHNRKRLHLALGYLPLADHETVISGPDGNVSISA